MDFQDEGPPKHEVDRCSRKHVVINEDFITAPVNRSSSKLASVNCNAFATNGWHFKERCPLETMAHHRATMRVFSTRHGTFSVNADNMRLGQFPDIDLHCPLSKLLQSSIQHFVHGGNRHPLKKSGWVHCFFFFGPFLESCFDKLVIALLDPRCSAQQAFCCKCGSKPVDASNLKQFFKRSSWILVV